MKIAHVINIFGAKQGSDSDRVREITLETMRRASIAASGAVEVELISAQYAEDRQAVPDFVHKTGNLTRSIQDDVECDDKRKLPYIHEIIEKACETSDAEFIVYTNLDISLYPSFYLFLEKQIASGIDALAINRAQIPRHIGKKDTLHDRSIEELYHIRNRSPHHGIDCVMFRREAFRDFRKADICIGYPPVGQYLLENVEKTARQFKWFPDAQETFHIGIDADETSPWKKLQGNSIWIRNTEEFEACRIHRLDAWQRHGIDRKDWIFRRLRWICRRFIP